MRQLRKALDALKLIGATAERVPDPDYERAKWLLHLTGMVARSTVKEIEEETKLEPYNERSMFNPNVHVSE